MGSAGEAPPTLEQVVEGFGRFLKASDSLRAEARTEWTNRGARHGKPEISKLSFRHVLTLKKPGFYLGTCVESSVEESVGTFELHDGKKAWQYLPSLNQFLTAAYDHGVIGLEGVSFLEKFFLAADPAKELQELMGKPRLAGTEKVDGTDCLVLVFSHGGSDFSLALRPEDFAPVRVLQKHAEGEILTCFGKFEANVEIPADAFAFKPPPGATEMTEELPPLLATGSQAPDFEALDVASAKTVRLSDYRGKAVFLVFWWDT